MTDPGGSSKGGTNTGGSGCNESVMASLFLEGIPKFSGDDKTMSSSKWAQDVEDNAAIFLWTPTQKLIMARKSLVGTAALWLRSEKAFATYDDLKTALLKEFPDVVNIKETHEIMAARKKKKDETLYQYMLHMRELGRRAKFPDYVAIQYIIDGIPDHAMNKAILYGVSRYDALKERLLIYEKIKNSSHRIDPEPRSASKMEPRKIREKKKCFNCGEIGHIASTCQNGFKCFKCNKFGHIGSQCHEVQTISSSEMCRSVKQHRGNINLGGARGGEKSIKQRLSMFNMAEKATAAANHDAGQDDSSNRMTSELSTIVMNVENKFGTNRSTKLVNIGDFTVNSLIDSGSDVNLMSYECCVAIGARLKEDNLTFKGLGQSTVQSMGKVYVNFIIDDKCYNEILFHVVRKAVIPFHLILGQEWLQNLTVVMKEGVVSFLGESDAWMCQLACFTDLRVDVDHIRDQSVKEKVLQCVEAYKPCKIKEAPIELKIILKDDEPVCQRPRRLSLVEQGLVENQVKEWLDAGIIQVSYSEYSSPLVLVKKKDNTVRVCVDYRLLNKKIIKDEFPLPVIDDIIDKLCEAKVFSVLDLKNGFFHLKISEESIPYTSFVTHNGQYEFLRAPFGLSICPKYFMRFITIIFRELIAQGIMLIFIDDIIIMAKDEVQAAERLQMVLRVAAEYGLQINWKKVNLIQHEIEYLGHIIKDGEVKPSPEKTDAVVKFPEPRNIKQVHSFVGLTSYFRKYIQDYALIAKPLTDLLKKDGKFVFGEEQRKAFETLKNKLASSPVLKIFDPRLKTELHTDASSMAYSAILLQHHPHTGLHPVQYMSRKTNEAQSRYSSYELEAMAVIEGIKKFRHYLYGIPFKIVTDCKAFEMTLRKKDLTPKVARWVLFLDEYDFEVEHRSGSKMRHADALSRYPYVGAITLSDQLKNAQDQDDGLRAIKTILKEHSGIYEDYWTEDDIIYKGENKLLVIPKTLEKNILERVHSNGHFSKKKMKELIEKEYYIKGLDKKIEEFILTCIPCLLATKKEGKQEGFLQPIEKGSVPLDTLHLDHVGPLTQTKKQYNYILTLVDAFTKFVWLFPTKSTSSRETISKLQVHQQTFGNPRRIITDRGTAFTSDEFADYCREENIQHLCIVTGVPRGNGQVERIHRTIIPLFTKLCIEDPSAWFKHVGKVQRALNSTYQRSINMTPFEVLIGTKMRTKEDVKIQELLQEESINQYDETREKLRIQAKEQIMKIQDENRKNYDKKRKESSKYKCGDKVAIRRTQFGTGLKLKPKYLGPYNVVKVKRNDRYDVEKIYSSDDGPMRTSSSADYMKRWPGGELEYNE
ncbi:unnamed protein product [Euphydryas editha]|uniref:RNA-directed DNA polymerase n=1 Tax=Euphydryas editha TaxID=104508 RepID=A0AAU9U5K2_EUPED|nr:unnamed protein product [Euphydryas editha]